MSPPPPIYTLDELMEVRAEARRGRSFQSQLGTERFQDMVSYAWGYGVCCAENGFRDHEFRTFIEWLRDVRGEFPEGWRDHYVEVCEGDHEKAMKRFLGFVAEFLELHPKSPPASPSRPGPQATPEHPVSILDVMMRAHERARSGQPLWLSYGTHTLPAMATHIRGYLRCCERNSFPDARWLAFTRWLSDARGLHPSTWVDQLLHDCRGDHERAMMRLLDLVAEYTLRAPSPD